LQTVLVHHPPDYPAERAYALDVVLGHFLGVAWEGRAEAGGRHYRITLAGDGLGRELRLPDVFFQAPRSGWLTGASCPQTPLGRWRCPAEELGIRLVSPDVPVLFGRPPGAEQAWWSESGGRAVECGVDVFGSAFFLLTRYEEVARAERDRHDRFSTWAALGVAEGHADRPLVDEYVEILWGLLRRLWPGLRRKRRDFQLLLSHDVDHPLCEAGGPLRNAGALARDLLVRRDPGLAVRRLVAAFQARAGRHDYDPCNTFDFLMDASERHGLRSAFYFIAGHSGGEIDGSYSLQAPFLQALLRRVHARGHEVGLHPSYNTFRDGPRLAQEFRQLLAAAERAGVRQDRWGGRQHYLRWENPVTWQLWADAGLHYDSTLALPELVGFRCGTCQEYPAFNLKTGQRLPLWERPLVVMDTTLFFYMRLPWEEAAERVVELCDRCRLFGGNFTLQWHNNNLLTGRDKRWYLALLARLASPA
jgi:hypothetical protein